MLFDPPLIPARLIRRYKRFLADVILENGDTITVHCPNTGSMLGCLGENLPVWLSVNPNPARKYRHTWELVEVRPGVLVGIHTGRTNRLVEEALRAGRLPGIAADAPLRREVKSGQSRMDLWVDDERAGCFIEVKNVSAAVDDTGVAFFPDSVSLRGSRHLRELMAVVETGQRAILCFCVQRGDVTEVRPADTIDSLYGRTLREAMAHGVEVVALGAAPTPRRIVLERRLPVVCPEI